MTERRLRGLPPHVVVMLSASTAAYAVLLAGVAGLQAGDEAAIAAARAPLATSLDRLEAQHDALAGILDRSRASYDALGDTYAGIAGRLGALEATLSGFAGSVAEIDGQARSLPTSFRVPALRTVTKVSVPKTQGTSGASGG
ncbi:MAG: hypothetical protein FIA92_13285 [Chloroflexi bacterium]|nr:hypothetical protein [Chloroflexota bacterium]